MHSLIQCLRLGPTPSVKTLTLSFLQSQSNMPPPSFTGVVTKAGFMNKTVTVTVSRWVIHKLTGKRIQRSKKQLVHDELNQLRQDDVVVIRNCRALSARKRFTFETLLKSPHRENETSRTARIQAQNSTLKPQQGSVLEALKKS